MTFSVASQSARSVSVPYAVYGDCLRTADQVARQVIAVAPPDVIGFSESFPLCCAKPPADTCTNGKGIELIPITNPLVHEFHRLHVGTGTDRYAAGSFAVSPEFHYKNLETLKIVRDVASIVS